MTIRALSFDFDGCLFNRHYFKTRNLLQANQAFLDQIKQENKKFTKVYTFVGSSRQSERVDRVNRSKRGSCFPAVQVISQHLGATSNQLLLADIYDDLPIGTSFARAIDANYRGDHGDWVFDETKATIIYAQLHHIAHQHSHEPIIMDFYDDRGLNKKRKEDDILEYLRNFYQKFPDLIPANVKLRLHYYAGNETVRMTEIQGTGFIDSRYRETVKEMARQVWSEDSPNKVDVARFLKVNELTSRKPLRVDSPSISPMSVGTPLEPDDSIPMSVMKSAELKAALEGIKRKADELNHKAEFFYYQTRHENKQDDRYYSYKEAAKAAHVLHKTLEVASHNAVDQSTFKATADQAIAAARQSALKDHRSHMKEILGYAGLAVLAVLSVLTAGIFYAIAGGVNYAVNRQFLFSTTIKTDSINQVDKLADVVDRMTRP